LYEYWNEITEIIDEIGYDKIKSILLYKEFAYKELLPMKINLNGFWKDKIKGMINFAFVKREMEKKSDLELMKIFGQR